MKSMRLTIIGAAALAGLALAGCATRTPVEPAGPVRPAPEAAALSPELYMAMAGSSALLSLRSAELLEHRTRSPALRAFAAKNIVEQGGIGAQLSFAGRRVNLLPAASLLPAHQAMYDALAASSDFDTTYLAQQRKVHEAAYSVHRSFSRSGTSPTLRPVAKMAEPVLQRALEALRRL